MKEILLSLCLSLALTLAAELSLALLLGVRGGRNMAVIALANLLTNPAVNYISYWAIWLFEQRFVYYAPVVIILELAAVFIEFLIYRRLLTYSGTGKLKLSVLLNGASFLLGLLVSGMMRLAA